MIFRTNLHSLLQQVSAPPGEWVEPQEKNILFTVQRIAKGRRDLNRYLALSAWAPDSGFSWFRTCKCEEWSLLSWHLWIHQRMFQMSLLYLQALLWSFAWIPRHYLFFLGKTAVKRRPGKPHSLHEPGEALILTLLGREERRTELSEGPVGFCLKC